ncbi:MAG: hypothetical protein M3R68_11780 [Acidobacteriota bacterium]|nr:hypothetical protein [Acidobacteriota bacterium]
MINKWTAEQTSTHQDHVIAHVIGTSVLGYFVLDESLHILLDIGFVWTIYLDGQMVLLPQTAAIGELAIEADLRSQIGREIELLERDGRATQGFEHLTPSLVECVITEVNFFACDERRRLVLIGETANLAIETSLSTGEVEVMGG